MNNIKDKGMRGIIQPILCYDSCTHKRQKSDVKTVKT